MPGLVTTIEALIHTYISGATKLFNNLFTASLWFSDSVEGLSRAPLMSEIFKS